MANFSYTTEVNAPIQTVWNFVRHIDHWSPLVPGYVNHTIVSDTETIWVFKTKLGVIKKQIELKVMITNENAPELVEFILVGLNEKCSGSGYFLAKANSSERTEITGYLEIQAEGKMAKLVNSKLNATVPELTTELTETVAAKLQEMIVK